MIYATIFLLALSLSMDAFAVSISNGLCYSPYREKEMLATAFAFGAFQGIMPAIGYFVGTFLGPFIQSADHWIAFVLLGFIGGKMIWEAVRSWDEPASAAPKAFSLRTLLFQAIATSIDALAVGISLAIMDVNIFLSAALIAIVTFTCSLIGAHIGKKCSSLLRQKAEILGGVILVGIGIKILVEHLMG